MNNSLLISNRKDNFRYISQSEYAYRVVVDQEISTAGKSVKLRTFYMDNFIPNISTNNNIFYYITASPLLGYSYKIQQDYYKRYSQLSATLAKALIDPINGGITFSITKDNNRLVLNFSQPVMLYYDDDTTPYNKTVYSMLGISPNHPIFTTPATTIVSDQPYNLTQTSMIYAKISGLPKSLDEDITFAIENNSFYGMAVVNQKKQKVLLRSAIKPAEILISLYDSQRNLLCQGFDKTCMPNIEIVLEF